MATGLSRLKPGVNKRSHLFLSAILWTGIGLLLIAKGGFRLSHLEEWDRQVLIIVLALLAGSFKAYFILDNSARRIIERILNFKDGTCLGAVYSVKTWILVLCMIGMGVILRDSSLPINLICLLYLTIGWALLLSSRLVWKVWLKGK